MIPLEEALRRVADAVGDAPVAGETVALGDALGRVLAADVTMDHDVPPFDRAAMDGFAVARQDARVGAELDVVGRVIAGDPPGARVRPGEALRIMTGAPLPAGAEVVVPVEWTVSDEAQVRIERRPDDADHVVRAGEHLRRGAVVAAAGTRVGPGEVAALATAGCARPRVARRPRVAILGTGNELVDVGAAPGPGRIRNSNGAMLRAQVVRAGGEPVDLGVAGDEAGALRAAIHRGLDGADLFVLSGGVSKGELDLVPDLLRAEAVACHFHHWAVQPGGPLWFGSRGRTLVFGLPGNPNASFVAFELLVVPAILARLGRGFAPRPLLRARWRGPWGRALPRLRLRPVRLETDAEGRLVAAAAAWKGSGDPFAAAGAEALALLPADRAAPTGPEPLVDVLPLEAWR